jgi:Lar family restriction alleviation protein
MSDSKKREPDKMQTAASFGATLLGAFLGKKTVSAATLGRATAAQGEENFREPAPATACPFCGAEQIQTKSEGSSYKVYYLHCSSCQARGPIAPSEGSAVENWQKRI